MRRRCAGTCRAAAVSSSSSPSSAMTPRSGLSRPAIMLTSEVLPAPDAPNRPVTRPSLANAASMKKSPSCFETSTRSISASMQAPGGAAGKEFGGDQRGHGDDDGDYDQAQRRGIAIGSLDQRVDCRRDSLGFAGDIGNEGNGGAELADRLGKSK